MPFNPERSTNLNLVLPKHLLELIDRRVRLGKASRTACIHRWVRKGIAVEVEEEEAARAKAAKEQR